MLRQNGFDVIDGFFNADTCGRLLTAVANYRAGNELPVICRRQPKRSLFYRVIDGEQVHRHFPDLEQIYLEVNQIVNELCGAELVPLANRTATININITPPGGEYRWHYDRNAVTAILYLNDVAGGETELLPNYRILLRSKKYTHLQRWFDRLLQADAVSSLFAKSASVEPKPGRLLIMRGDRCLHSVRAVRGESERINVIMTYDHGGAEFPVEADLDPYLYSLKASPSFDPNYRP